MSWQIGLVKVCMWLLPRETFFSHSIAHDFFTGVTAKSISNRFYRLSKADYSPTAEVGEVSTAKEDEDSTESGSGAKPAKRKAPASRKTRASGGGTDGSEKGPKKSKKAKKAEAEVTKSVSDEAGDQVMPDQVE